MEELWKEMEAWLTANAPNILEALNPGATDDEIESVERTLGVEFPTDFHESYRLHNGSRAFGAAPFPVGEFLSLGRIVDEWKVWKELVDDGDFEGIASEPVAGVRSDWYNVRWIPFTYDGAGNHHCLDLDPEKGGILGQIITMYHDGPEREIIALSFRDYVKQSLDRLHSGDYVYSAENEGIWKADDL